MGNDENCDDVLRKFVKNELDLENDVVTALVYSVCTALVDLPQAKHGRS